MRVCFGAGLVRAPNPAPPPKLRVPRVVAKGLLRQEDDDAEAVLVVRELTEEEVERNRLVLEGTLRSRVAIDRQQVMLALDLDAVAGEIDHGEGGVGVVLRELLDLDPRRLPLPVEEVFHGEADPLQRLADGVGVVPRLAEGRDVGIVVVADDEGDALGRTKDARTDGEKEAAADEESREAARSAWFRHVHGRRLGSPGGEFKPNSRAAPDGANPLANSAT